MKTKRLFIFLTICIAGTIAFNVAQAQTASTWQVTFPKSIAWQKSTTLGSILLYNYEGLYCVDNTNGKTMWERDDFKAAKNISEDNVEEIPNSPFISITSGKGDEDILSLMDGNTVFSSEANGYTSVTKKIFLYQNNTILIGGYKKGNKNTVAYSMIDMSTGKELWSKDNDEFKLFLGCFSAGDSNVIVATVFDIIKVNAKTGAEVWRKASDQQFKKMSDKNPGLAKGFKALMGSGAEQMAGESTGRIVSINKDNFIMAITSPHKSTSMNMGGMGSSGGTSQTTITYTTVYNCYSINSGDFVWSDKITVNDQNPVDLETPKGLVIISNTDNKIGLYDYNTGKPTWDRKVQAITSGGGLLVTAAILVKDKLILSIRAGSSKSRLKVFTLADGEAAYKDKVDKLPGMVTQLRDLPKGILVVTDEVVNMLNTATGEYYFDKSIESNANLIAENNDHIYIYSNKDQSIYVLDKNGTSISKLGNAVIKFDGKEDPTRVETRAEGVLLSSDQNIALVSYTGDIVYQKYYKAPGQSGFMKSLNLAAGIYASMVAVDAGVYSAAFAATSAAAGKSNNAMAPAVQQVAAQASDQAGAAAVNAGKYAGYYFKQMSARFKATTQGNDYTVMLYKTPEKKIELIVVSKKTGEITKQIDMSKDKTPNYSVDFIEKALYYIPQNNNKELQCYQF